MTRHFCKCLRRLNSSNICTNPRCSKNKTSTKKTRTAWTKSLKTLLSSNKQGEK